MTKRAPRAFPRLAVRPYRSYDGERKYGIYIIHTGRSSRRLASRSAHSDAMTLAQQLAVHMFGGIS